MTPTVRFVEGSRVRIGYERCGDPAGWPVVLLHGFPYDPRCYDEVVPTLVTAGADVVVPYLRGYGPSRYRDGDVIRSGQQVALARDLLELVDGLRLAPPITAGFDWGGRAACVAALLEPSRFAGLVSGSGYNVHDIATMSTTPDPPASEVPNWYQWYFHSERGRAGLDRYRRELTALLWSQWSPDWQIPAGAFAATASSFDNPDFVATVVHSYRHRYGLTPGDPVDEPDERIVAGQPPITVPTLVVDVTADPLDTPSDPQVHARRFPRLIGYRQLATGHDVPAEDPVGFASAVLDLRDRLS